MLALLSALALAHPMASTDRSLRTAMRLTPEALEVVVVLEVPIDNVRADVEAWRKAEPEGDAVAFRERYTQGYFDTLGETTTVTVDGVAVDAAFAPLDSPINGRGLEGFFTFVVQASLPPPSGERATVRVHLGGYPDASELWLSGLARAEAPWTVGSSSAEQVLGQPVTAEGVGRDPALWTRDPAMRSLEVVWTR